MKEIGAGMINNKPGLAIVVSTLVAMLGITGLSGCHSHSETTPGGSVKTVSYVGSLTPSCPAEAFNLQMIKMASLDELQWRQTELKVISGIRIVDGFWSPGTYTGPDAGNRGISTIILKSRARLYAPQTSTRPLPVIVYAAHLADAVPFSESSFINIASALHVALLVHGESPSDGYALGYTDPVTFRGSLVNDGINDLLQRNLNKITDLQTSNFGFVLARTNMLAFSLAQRLLESAGQSGANGALLGESKEGYATWLSAATDDRLLAVAPEGFQLQDLTGYDAFEFNSGCGPNGANGTVDIRRMLYIRDWLKNTAAGRQAAETLLVSAFASELKPSFFLIAGDVGMPGMHDGIHFSLGADSAFLAGFQKPMRHHRAVVATGRSDPQRLALIGKVLSAQNPAAEVASWVRVTSTSSHDTGTVIKIRAAIAEGLQAARAILYWNQSPNREFNDAAQTPWNRVELLREGNTADFSGTFLPDTGQEVAWFVRAEEAVDVGGVAITRTDSSPVAFLREIPPLACTSYPKP